MSYTDDFNRASLGANWTAIAYTDWSAGMQILSSIYAQGIGGGQNNGSYYNAGSFGSTPYSKITIYKPGTATDDISALLWKSTGVYVADLFSGDGHLYKVTSANSWTQLGSFFAHIVADGDTVQLEITAANAVRMLVNGVEKVSSADTTYRTLVPAIGSYYATTSYLCINDWEGGDLVAAGGLSIPVAMHYMRMRERH
jgi:hypothetical protein